eukprot:52633-Chlamydomonas_euryale.AAC.2
MKPPTVQAQQRVIRQQVLGRQRVTKSAHEGLQFSVQASHGTCSLRIRTIPQGGGPARREHLPVQGGLILWEGHVLPGGRTSGPHTPACLVDSEQGRSTHGLSNAGMHMRCRCLHGPKVLHLDGRAGGSSKYPHGSLCNQAPPGGMVPPCPPSVCVWYYNSGRLSLR